jgi:protein-disulfide reductase (glutathione)
MTYGTVLLEQQVSGERGLDGQRGGTSVAVMRGNSSPPRSRHEGQGLSAEQVLPVRGQQRRRLLLSPFRSCGQQKAFVAMMVGCFAGGVCASTQTRGPQMDFYTTALHRAARDGNERLLRAELAGGADIDWMDEKGNSALHHAAISDKPDIVRALLDHKPHAANLWLRNNEGDTPLLLAKGMDVRRMITTASDNDVRSDEQLRRTVTVPAMADGGIGGGSDRGSCGGGAGGAPREQHARPAWVDYEEGWEDPRYPWVKKDFDRRSCPNSWDDIDTCQQCVACGGGWCPLARWCGGYANTQCPAPPNDRKLTMEEADELHRQHILEHGGGEEPYLPQGGPGEEEDSPFFQSGHAADIQYEREEGALLHGSGGGRGEEPDLPSAPSDRQNDRPDLDALSETPQDIVPGEEHDSPFRSTKANSDTLEPTSGQIELVTSDTDAGSAKERLGRGFGDAVHWMRLDPGLAAARAQDRWAMVLIHKSWCSACKQLGPLVAADETIQRLSKLLIMINVQDDEEPTHDDDTFKPDGADYVPRVLFLSPEGKLLPQYSSDDVEYRYFYGSGGQIADMMRRAIKDAPQPGKPGLDVKETEKISSVSANRGSSEQRSAEWQWPPHTTPLEAFSEELPALLKQEKCIVGFFFQAIMSTDQEQADMLCIEAFVIADEPVDVNKAKEAMPSNCSRLTTEEMETAWIAALPRLEDRGTCVLRSVLVREVSENKQLYGRDVVISPTLSGFMFPALRIFAPSIKGPRGKMFTMALNHKGEAQQPSSPEYNDSHVTPADVVSWFDEQRSGLDGD